MTEESIPKEGVMMDINVHHIYMLQKLFPDYIEYINLIDLTKLVHKIKAGETHCYLKDSPEGQQNMIVFVAERNGYQAVRFYRELLNDRAEDTESSSSGEGSTGDDSTEERDDS